MSNILMFREGKPKKCDQVMELKEILVKGGFFDQVEDISTDLVLFLLQYWQVVYDTGYWEGLMHEVNEGTVH